MGRGGAGRRGRKAILLLLLLTHLLESLAELVGHHSIIAIGISFVYYLLII